MLYRPFENVTSVLDVMRNFLLRTVYSFQKFPKKRYIRYTLYPVCVQSGMGCGFVKGDSSALFTALKKIPRNVTSGLR